MNRNYGALREPRMGICLHYDASSSDLGAVDWLVRDPRCAVSYNWLVLDDGQMVEIVPPTGRAWHAGVCRSSNSPQLPYTDANSALYGVAIAATQGETATDAQTQGVVTLCRTLYRMHGWSGKETWRIVGHSSEAWPRGRKIDPEGPDPSRPVLSVYRVRSSVSQEPRPDFSDVLHGSCSTAPSP